MEESVYFYVALLLSKSIPVITSARLKSSIKHLKDIYLDSKKEKMTRVELLIH
jgi:hypothetical protein